MLRARRLLDASVCITFVQFKSRSSCVDISVFAAVSVSVLDWFEPGGTESSQESLNQVSTAKQVHMFAHTRSYCESKKDKLSHAGLDNAYCAGRATMRIVFSAFASLLKLGRVTFAAEHTASPTPSVHCHCLLGTAETGAGTRVM